MENEGAAGASVVLMASGLVLIYKEKFKHSKKPFLTTASDGDTGSKPGLQWTWIPCRFDLWCKHTGHGKPFYFPTFSINKRLIKDLISADGNMDI